MDIKEKCAPTDRDDPGLFKESYVDSTKYDCGNHLSQSVHLYTLTNE